MSRFEFFYASGAMGLDGKGYAWHKLFGVTSPKLPVVTKTLTLAPKKGRPWCVLPLGDSVFNSVALHNPGLVEWLDQYYDKDLIVSIHGTDEEIAIMVDMLAQYRLQGIELNFSCPCVNDAQNKVIPNSKHRLFVKFNCNQNPNDYDLSRVKELRLNSVPFAGGGLSGKVAQKRNWAWIAKYHEKYKIAGCDIMSVKDVCYLLDEYGLSSFGIGVAPLLIPDFFEKLSGEFRFVNKELQDYYHEMGDPRR